MGMLSVSLTNFRSGRTCKSWESSKPIANSLHNSAKSYKLEPGLFFSDLEEMLKETHPQAVLAYTNTYDHRRVVEICARYGVPVMMEKPLAVSVEDAHAIEKAAREGKIQVLVNYETPGIAAIVQRTSWSTKTPSAKFAKSSSMKGIPAQKRLASARSFSRGSPIRN